MKYFKFFGENKMVVDVNVKKEFMIKAGWVELIEDKHPVTPKVETAKTAIKQASEAPKKRRGRKPKETKTDN